MSYKKNIFLLLFIVCVGGLEGQTSMESLPVPATLEQCVDYALSHNISIAKSQLNVNSSVVDRRDAWGAFLPSVTASSNYNHSQGFSFDANTNQRTTSTQQAMSVSAGLSLNVFNGLRDLNNYRRSQLSLAAARYANEKILSDVKLNVVSAYLTVLSAIEYEKVTESQCELSRLQVERMNRLIAVGKNAQGDLYEVEATLARDEQLLVDARNQKTMAYIALRQLLSLDIDAPLEIVPVSYEKLSRVEVLNHTPYEIYVKAMEGLPEMNKARKDVEVASRNLAIARSGYSPTINAGYSWSNSFTFDYKNPATGDPITIGDQWRNNSRHYFQVGLSIPIFNRMSTITSVQHGKINLMMAEYTLNEASLALQQKIEQAYADATSSLQSYRAAEKAAAASAEALRYATAKFEQSKLSAYEYETAKNQLLRSQTDVLRAKYDYIFKTFLLEYYHSQKIKI